LDALHLDAEQRVGLRRQLGQLPQHGNVDSAAELLSRKKRANVTQQSTWKLTDLCISALIFTETEVEALDIANQSVIMSRTLNRIESLDVSNKEEIHGCAFHSARVGAPRRSTVG
jgi:ABC-type sugar transport system ATPase subunit